SEDQIQHCARARQQGHDSARTLRILLALLPAAVHCIELRHGLKRISRRRLARPMPLEAPVTTVTESAIVDLMLASLPPDWIGARRKAKARAKKPSRFGHTR